MSSGIGLRWQEEDYSNEEMRVLIVHSGNAVGGDSSKYTFVREQGEAIQQHGCTVGYFAVMGKGARGYLRNIYLLRKKIAEFQPDIIHAHYGLCGLMANLATRRIPVVTTYHGSDINLKKVRMLSQCSIRLSAWNIFVSNTIANKVICSSRKSIIPCGIELPKPEEEYPSMQHVLSPNQFHVLFAGAFDNPVKDSKLAFEGIRELEKEGINDVELIELKGYTREEVFALMYQVEMLLLTSKTEGSPQVIKEAIACGCPIVSVDVGDVRERLRDIESCYVVENRSAGTIAECIKHVLQNKNGRYNGREIILRDKLTHPQIAERIVQIYEQILDV